MPKKKLTITKRIDKVESKIIQHDETLSEIDKKLSNHFEHLTLNFDQLSSDVKAINKSWDEINQKVDKILNIRVNGSIGLENSLKTLFEITRSERVKYRMLRSIVDYTKANKLINFLIYTKSGKFIIGFVLLLLTSIIFEIGLKDLFKLL